MSKGNKFGLVVGDRVECISRELDYYDKGEVYLIGFDMYGDFGVLDGDGHVMDEGCVSQVSWNVSGYARFSFDNFRKVE